MLADYLQCPFADGDDFHPPANIAKMKAGRPLDDEDREEWLYAIHDFVQKKMQKTTLVLACSALKQAYRKKLTADIAEDQIRWVHLQGDYDLILQRMQAREGHFMPSALLRSQFEAYEKPDRGCLISVHQSPEEILQQIIVSMSLQTQFGIVGLGVMGRNLARNFARNGVVLSLFNRFVAEKEEKVAAKAISEFPELHAARAFEDIPAFVQSIGLPRKIFLMVNAGPAVDEVLDLLLPHLSDGDIIMDGGNSHYEDTQRRQQKSGLSGVKFLGVGVSGGESGALNGPAIMAGGDASAYREVAPLLSTIAAKDSSGGACAAYIGPDGAGHFVKMVHNGIEYAEMQLLAELYSALRWDLGHDPGAIANILSEWANSGLRSYLLDITVAILRRKEANGWLLDLISDKAAHKGTGSWASIAASELGTPLTMMTEALFARFMAALRDYRHQLAPLYAADSQDIDLDINALKESYRLARIINHHQGFQMINAASKRYDWSVDMPDLARIWTNGCIIRSDLMQEAVVYLKEKGDLLCCDDVVALIRKQKPFLQNTVAALCKSHRAYPCLMSALASLNGLTTAYSAAHLIQAQRDYFGAHLYERIDDTSGKKYHTEWEI